MTMSDDVDIVAMPRVKKYLAKKKGKTYTHDYKIVTFMCVTSAMKKLYCSPEKNFFDVLVNRTDNQLIIRNVDSAGDNLNDMLNMLDKAFDLGGEYNFDEDEEEDSDDEENVSEEDNYKRLAEDMGYDYGEVNGKTNLNEIKVKGSEDNVSYRNIYIKIPLSFDNKK